MASAQVIETSVNTNNSPSQDYTTNPDDHSNHNQARWKGGGGGGEFEGFERTPPQTQNIDKMK